MWGGYFGGIFELMLVTVLVGFRFSFGLGGVMRHREGEGLCIV